MSDQLKPCPFCGCAVQPINGFDYVRIYGQHAHSCPFLGDDPIIADAAEWNTRAQPSDGGLTNEPFCYTTPGMVEVAKAIKAGSGVGRIGAKLVKDARFCVPLHLSPPAPASVVLPVRAAAYGNRLQEWYTTGWNACLDRVKELNS